MQYSQEHLKTMVYAEFGGQTECIMGNWKIENGSKNGQGCLTTQITTGWETSKGPATSKLMAHLILVFQSFLRKMINQISRTQKISEKKSCRKTSQE